MEIHIEIRFIILCLAVLVSIIGILKYQFKLDKDKVDISPQTNIDQPNNSSIE